MRKLILVLALAAMLAPCSHALIWGVEVGGLPYLEFKLNQDQDVDVGLTYSSQDDGNRTNMVIFGRLNNRIAESSKIRAGWGVQISYGSAYNKPWDETTSTLTLAGLLSAEYKINEVLGFYGNLNLLTYQSVDTDGASASSYWLLTGPLAAYTGFRVYM